jgi:hypothetical protein
MEEHLGLLSSDEDATDIFSHVSTMIESHKSQLSELREAENNEVILEDFLRHLQRRREHMCHPPIPDLPPGGRCGGKQRPGGFRGREGRDGMRIEFMRTTRHHGSRLNQGSRRMMD